MQKFETLRQPLLEFSITVARTKEEKKNEPKIVATFVSASSQGQRTHSARTKIATRLANSILQALESNVNNGSCSMVSIENQRKDTSWFEGMVKERITQFNSTSSTGQSSDKFAAQNLVLFIKKFQMLWKAIKKETYVFKSKNIQAVKAFEHIQGEYDKQVGEFRTQFHDLAKNILNISCTRLLLYICYICGLI